MEITSIPEVQKPSLDAILVFGQGPVINRVTREHAASDKTQPGSEDINFWSHTLAQAAIELHKRKVTQRVIVMGGRTGDDPGTGLTYKAEAQIIGEDLKKASVPADLEMSSTNTLENLVNLLNEHPGIEKSRLGILGANQHIGRLRVLMELFDIPYQHVFSSEEVIRFAARDRDKWDQDTLLEIEQRLDMNAASRKPLSGKDKELGKGYYRQKVGTEQKTVYRRFQEEDVWRQVLDEIPEYWIGYLGRLHDVGRARTILQKRGEEFLSEIKRRFIIDLADSDKELLSKLGDVKRVPPDGSSNWGVYLEKRIVREWPDPLKKELEPIAQEKALV